MYYPYLRAKQFELKALKDFFQECPDENRIIPILEPVNRTATALLSAAKCFIDNRKCFALILNPRLGDFEHSTVPFSFPEDNPELMASNCCIPAYWVENNANTVAACLEAIAGTNVMLVFPKGADTEVDTVRALVDTPQVSTIVCSFSKTSRRTKNYLLGLGKNIVTFEDNFNEQKRNADYLNMEDEHFSETFYYYAEDNFQGFSDYTALPSSFSSDGMLPYALAIHLTYIVRDDQINIHHFVSDSNRDQSNIKGKFFEAARKVVDFYGNGIYHTRSVDEIIHRAGEDDGFPGLGYLKKLSVKNHLELIQHLLG